MYIIWNQFRIIPFEIKMRPILFNLDWIIKWEISEMLLLAQNHAAEIIPVPLKIIFKTGRPTLKSE